MQHDFEAEDLDDLVKGVGLGDVGDDEDGEIARGVLRGVGRADLSCLFLGADGRHHAVAFGEELLQDVGWRVLVSGSDLSLILGANVPAMKPEPPEGCCLCVSRCNDRNKGCHSPVRSTLVILGVF